MDSVPRLIDRESHPRGGMQRALIIGVLFYTLLLAGLFTLRGELVALSIPFAVYYFLGLLFGPREIKLKITRWLSTERVPFGMPVRINLSIQNLGQELEQVFLEDQVPDALDLQEGTSRRLVRLARGGTLN